MCQTEFRWERSQMSCEQIAGLILCALTSELYSEVFSLYFLSESMDGCY